MTNQVDTALKAQKMPEKIAGFRSLDTPVQYVKGVGPRLSSTLGKLGIFSVRDLVYHFPKRHEDRTRFARVSELEHGESATIKGAVLLAENISTRGRLTITKVAVDDGSGVVTLAWFNQAYRRDQFSRLKGRTIIAYGTAQFSRWGFEISNPDWEIYTPDSDSIAHGRLVPVYSLTEGLFQDQMRQMVAVVLDGYLDVAQENLSESLRDRLDLMDISDALRNIHFPESQTALDAARHRLVFEEFFLLQLALALRKQEETMPGQGIAFTIPDSFDTELRQILSFELTGAQKRVIREVLGDMERPLCMNRLLQGDVGCGKTAVAMAAMLLSARNGYQSALMAPTEILAEQHFLSLSRSFGNLGVLGLSVELLTGSLKSKQRQQALERIRSGQTQLVVGTHALIQECVEFQKLGLVIVDEQHRFGVMQRAALVQKGATPDILVMTATPIPRTLTLTIYGDLDVSIIDEMPPGRKPVKTHWKQIGERAKVYEVLKSILEHGKQAYVVCPLIEESDKLQVKAATELEQELANEHLPGMSVGLLHGQLRTDEKEAVMAAFRAGEIRVLVSTTVIEVGVDVPNAVCMIIEDADRFGLAQLHQLRGRVGRGPDQSFCILICEGNSEDSIKRMQTMSSTTDGFLIAEEDLKLRGPGEFYGTKQSGMPSFQIADIFKDMPILEEARKEAFQLVGQDHSLAAPENRALKKTLLEKFESFQLAIIS